MRNIILALSFLVLPLAAFADADGFHKRFELIRKDGKLIHIKDRSIISKFTVGGYVSFIKEQLQNEQRGMRDKSAYEEEILYLFDETDLRGSEHDLELILDSLGKLVPLDFDKIFANENFKDVIRNFEIKMSDVLDALNPNIVASPSNARFFYRKRATGQVLRWALNYAKRKLSSIPALNTVSYVLVQAERLIRERREFHQNILLHYFERYPAAELGMTDEEVDHSYSSIYESRIQWFAFWESNSAAANWNRYGTNSFYAGWRAATMRIRSQQDRFEALGERVNYAFQEATLDGQRVIVNLMDNQAQFSQNWPLLTIMIVQLR